MDIPSSIIYKLSCLLVSTDHDWIELIVVNNEEIKFRKVWGNLQRISPCLKVDKDLSWIASHGEEYAYNAEGEVVVIVSYLDGIDEGDVFNSLEELYEKIWTGCNPDEFIDLEQTKKRVLDALKNFKRRS